MVSSCTDVDGRLPKALVCFSNEFNDACVEKLIRRRGSLFSVISFLATSFSRFTVSSSECTSTDILFSTPSATTTPRINLRVLLPRSIEIGIVIRLINRCLWSCIKQRERKKERESGGERERKRD